MNTSCEVNESIVLPDSLRQILEGYKQFREITLQGGHGKTAQYYLQYTELVNIYLRFSRSIRCSNFELYLNSISEICDYFFAFNLPNYSKWAALYLNNLIKLKTDNSPLLMEFREGAFGVRRTKSCLGRSPVDLTLEQTINADAGNTLTGVSHFTNSISARQRWALSHSMRTKILSAVKVEIGLSHSDDTSYSLEKNRIEKDNKTLSSILETIKKTMDPFDENLDKNILFNMSTGKAASSNVADFLLNIKSLGHQLKLRFFSECFKDSLRFVKPIKRNNIHNFASDCVKKLIKGKNRGNQAIIKMERDIFGRLLAIAINKKVDIEYCLSYPLAPVPPALFHCTGHMFKTDKSTFSKHLKSKIEPSHPGQIEIEIIDGFYYMYYMGTTLPQTFGKLCSSNASEVHIIFDRYLTPSIKDCERQNRKKIDIPYSINGKRSCANQEKKTCTKIAKAIVYSSSESEAENVIYEEESDIEGITLEELNRNDNPSDEEIYSREIVSGDYILIKFVTKKKVVHYVALVENVDENEFGVSYLRRKGDKFMFPQVPEKFDVPKEDIVMKLPVPTFHGGTPRVSQKLVFAINFAKFNVN
ncbi:unnamed protein product [Brassicogethes aeneus]|uniref:Uncharacterized protein n=1 Tax=Brassicogethes aeneus TaxID=1431903 RepID=A0A9P0B500_BRAAE|nr:unnamed protein product [Brassicogethes aeneus]